LKEKSDIRNEAIVRDRRQFADEGSVSEHGSACLPWLLYFDERPDGAAIYNRAPINVNWLDDGNVPIKLHIDNPSTSNKELHSNSKVLPHSHRASR